MRREKIWGKGGGRRKGEPRGKRERREKQHGGERGGKRERGDTTTGSDGTMLFPLQKATTTARAGNSRPGQGDTHHPNHPPMMV